MYCIVTSKSRVGFHPLQLHSYRCDHENVIFVKLFLQLPYHEETSCSRIAY